MNDVVELNDEDTLTWAEVRSTLERVRSEAAGHNQEYGCGIRFACAEAEKEFAEKIKDE